MRIGKRGIPRRLDDGSRMSGDAPVRICEGLEVKFLWSTHLKNENKIDIDVVNDIPANSPTPYYNDSVGLGANMPKHFIFCSISYRDPILKKEYIQSYYMKWDGVINGQTLPDFTHVNTTEKMIIENYVKNNA